MIFCVKMLCTNSQNSFCSPGLSSHDDSGFLEILAVSWATRIFVKGFKQTLQNEDLGELGRSMTAEVSRDRLMRLFAEEKANRGGKDFSLGKVFWRMVRTSILLSVTCLLLYLSIDFISSVSICFLCSSCIDSFSYGYIDKFIYSFIHLLIYFDFL